MVCFYGDLPAECVATILEVEITASFCQNMSQKKLPCEELYLAK
jgi:hypothetical protein